MSKYKKYHGFTLLELLVVIAIIALLLSITMPALSKVRKQAKAVVCVANVRQWSVLIGLYATDYDGRFFQGNVGSDDPGQDWNLALRPYYQDVSEIRLCPSAIKIASDLGIPDPSVGGRTRAWGRLPAAWNEHYGSYVMNNWLCNPPSSGDALLNYLGFTPSLNWRKASVGMASEIPVFTDGIWVDIRPHYGDIPLQVDDDPDVVDVMGNTQYAAGPVHSRYWWNNMRTAAFNRHEKRNAVGFLDGSARRVEIKELWDLKWHRKWSDERGDFVSRNGGNDHDWPSWME